jgi:hypothetical protein
MSYKRLQLSPLSSTRVIRPSTTSTGFVESWFENSTNRTENPVPHRINWGAILGLALSVTVSVGFWGGVVWIVARVWK